MGGLRRRKNDSEKKFPNLSGSQNDKNNNDSAQESNDAKIFSVKLEVYQNVRALRNAFSTVRLSDLSKIPGKMLHVLMARERKNEIKFSSDAKVGLIVITLLTLCTRLYQIGEPHHIW